METETEKKISDTNIALISISVFLVIFIIYYSVMMMLSPGKKYAAIRNEFGIDTTEKSRGSNPIFSDSTYLKLLKEKAFLQSRMIMAESDSIYLTLNLSDSTMNLEISGVSVHQARFSYMEASKIFLKGDENLILSLMTSPFTIAKDRATIKKEPVLVKMAPRDTSEYKPDVVPDTSLTEPVNYILEMTDGTRIYICQEEEDNARERRSQFRFDLNYRMVDAWSCMKSIVRFRIPDYHLYIKIYLPRSDARIIYRAIPKYGQVGLYR
ncbi:MAG: hypothetical protein A2X05_07440 [Bacteroidetes bacterium GWE2_41_25]|nr:MAG: hypothetical protein A2X03_05525 [Bacteroidetes bacterium GWA2_40_15]OFX89723.1 MAG: hypothetical protein A2X06_09745 [Bacteroidetes bacterium GWC2_40_22]OFY00649.1 MAG: hypothetical protein A2X05_07440 [Bacteroidetes bacterium GWE2_41_25]OFY61284.1 MAG: hypothetical protein A2X04_09015 [Bacteroidetes bacterium GWF2_41_9]HAM10790.1 hypothetical protein [Bacteroidales bacterium]